MPMSITRRLVEHSSIYIFGQVIVTAGGLISFPIIVRLLTKDQYGTMILISVSVVIIEAFASLGLNHSVLRFYSKYEEKKEVETFSSTLIIGSFIFGIAGAVFTILTTKLLGVFQIVSLESLNVFVLAAFLIPIRTMMKVISCMYRVRENPWIYSVFSILAKFVGLGLIILFLAFCYLGLFGYYLGLALGELAVLVALWFFYSKQVGLSINKFSLGVLRKATAYGFPMVLSSLAAVLLSSSDRYMIGYFLTNTDVAIYSVAYNLCSYLSGILLTGFQLGFIPLIMKEWNRNAREGAHLEIQRVIRLYCMVALPLTAGLCIVGQQMIVMLASEKYAQSFYILPYVAIALMINGLGALLMLGFWFSNQTKKVAILMTQAAILNFLMNLILILRLGLYGAAISTLFCYVFLLIIGSIKSSKYFRIKIPWYPIFLYGICTLLMYLSLKSLKTVYPSSHLVTQIGIGVFSYVSFLFIVDKKLRRVAILHIYRFVDGSFR